MNIKHLSTLAFAAAALTACSADGPAKPAGEPEGPAEPAPPAPPAPPAGPAETRPSGQPALSTYQGTVEQGVECRVLRTDTGERWAFNTDAAIAVGDRVAITAEVADASFCQEGQGTLIVESIAVIDPRAD